jgi:endonuclease/exonuclease/phosphatase family metal-dependent hydrolase
MVVNYGLASYKQKQKPAWLAADPAQKQRVHERSLENKRKLAEAIDDSAMLITGIRFYIAHLRVNRRTPAAPIRAIEREKSRRSGQHLKAVRRLLGISYRKASTLARKKHKPWVVAGDVMMMPGSYRAKLEALGFAPLVRSRRTRRLRETQSQPRVGR